MTQRDCEIVGIDKDHEAHVAIIIVNWNGWSDTIECIDTVLAQRYSKFSIYIVDNDSADSSVERIVDWLRCISRIEGAASFHEVSHYSDSHSGRSVEFNLRSFGDKVDGNPNSKVTVIRSGFNGGFAFACNVGIKLAAEDREFDFYWMLNSDTVVETDALARLIDRAARAASIGMVGSTLRYYRAPYLVQALGGASYDEANCRAMHIGETTTVDEIASDSTRVEGEMAYVVGASLLVSASFIHDIGNMREDYFLYYEEFDWAARSKGRFTMAYAPLSVVYHKAGASSKDTVGEFSQRLMHVNRIKFFARYFPLDVRRLRLRMIEEMARHIFFGRAAQALSIFRVIRDESLTAVSQTFCRVR